MSGNVKFKCFFLTLAVLFLLLFLLISTRSVFSESMTGYDGAGIYIADKIFDEKESQKLIAKRLEGKRQKFSEKIKKNLTSDLYHYLLGDVYLEMRRPAMAIASFEEVIRLNPKNGKAHYQLAKAFDQINDTSKAKRHLAKASQIFEDNLDLHWKTKIDAFLLQLRQHK